MIAKIECVRLLVVLLPLLVLGPAPCLHAQSEKDSLRIEVGSSIAEAIALWRNGQIDTAIVLSTSLLETATKEFGAADTLVAEALHVLGGCYYSQADYQRCETLWRQSMLLREEILGPEHPVLAISLNNLALLLMALGKYSEADLLCHRSLGIKEKVFGPDSAEVATARNNLAILSILLGKYAESELLLKQALPVREQTLGQEHPLVAETLANLATLYEYQGRYAESEPLYTRALAIAESAFGPTHPFVASCLDNLAVLYVYQQRYEEAEPLHVRALEISEGSVGPDHPDVAHGLHNLGYLYGRMGKFADAELLFARSLAIMEKAGYYGVPEGLLGLGNMKSRQGKYAEAQSLYSEALAMSESALGESHRCVAQSLESMCRLHRLQNETAEATESAVRACGLRRKSFMDNATVLSERDALTYSQFLRNSVSQCLTCYSELELPDSVVIGETADVIFSSKGQVSDEMFERQRAIVEETDSATLELAESLRLAKFQLSTLFVEGPGKDVEAYRKEVDSLSELANEFESGLSRRSASFRRQEDYKDISAERIASLIPTNSVLVEYAKYTHHELQTDRATSHYMVAVLGETGTVVIIDIGEASKIDALVNLYRDHMSRVSAAGRMPSALDQGDYRRISDDLYTMIWRPIDECVTGKNLVLIAPDGALNMLSFAGLLDGDSKYLIERFPIHYLSSGRDLIRLKDKVEPGRGLLAFGDPDYDAPGCVNLQVTATHEQPAAQTASHVTKAVRSGCGRLREITVSRLPGTRKEVELIASGWRESTTEPLSDYFGPEASEGTFKFQAPGKRVIHLATHGYFLEGVRQPEMQEGGFGSDIGFVGENPLLLSGLFLAGANLHGTGADSAGAEDGILTAYEVSAMDLVGTELVVLSACQTGLGQVKDGEGVYGLRRAFQMAGARTVVSALWPVSDEVTAEMMGSLYERRDGSLPGTIRKLQLERIKELRRQGKVDHPFTWAPFIATGDWR